MALGKWATGIAPLYRSESHYKELLAADVEELSTLQRLLYASEAYSVLLIFQAMDAAGKDGVIRHVLSGVNPQGCEVQRKRFLQRIDEPDKNWKFGQTDLAERKLWDRYIQAYEACMGATGTRTAPWHLVPEDDKLNARLIVLRIVIDVLRGLEMDYPRVSPARRRELQAIREELAKPLVLTAPGRRI